MINKLEFEIDVVEKSDIPYVAAGGGIWVTRKHVTEYLSEMSEQDLKKCLYILNKETDCKQALKELEPVMKQKVTDNNRRLFLDHLEKLKKNKITEIESLIQSGPQKEFV